jgi:NitT/TauT family transport system substrate-binding protein
MAWGAPEKPQLKFALDWVLSGAHAAFVLAAEGEYFAGQGLQVAISRGHGSADTARRVAAGEADFGIAELGVIARHNALEPAHPLTAIYLLHERSPLAVISVQENGIEKPSDLRGKVIGAPEGEAGRLLFPLFAAATGLGRNDVQWSAMEPALRESHLVAGRVDAITGAVYSARFLELQGIRRDRIRVLRYADHGVPLYGQVVFARADFLQRHPRTAAAFSRAINDALLATIAQPPLAIEALRRRVRLPPEGELQRLRHWIDEVVTARARQQGLSQVDPARLQRTIDLVVTGLRLPRRPEPQVLYTEAYLPRPDLRQLSLPAPPCRTAPGQEPLPGCR